jgi:hypothetical protein
MNGNDVLSLVLGIVLLALGPIVFRFRGQIARMNRAGQRQMIGKLADRPSVQRRSQQWTGVVGVLFFLSGGVMIFMAFLRHHW